MNKYSNDIYLLENTLNKIYPNLQYKINMIRQNVSEMFYISHKLMKFNEKELYDIKKNLILYDNPSLTEVHEVQEISKVLEVS